ncbi:uncharacterized protein LOC111629983 [Centruroides sculpturatus]|uniref:uncharacterized protein LOC111628638 n=1 Tax=Centruroides sculpturatus TaxID=218467 RepID=UPI000C6CC0C3|nr:uncharacterized protein LOC111628638 [Centruroides sculpturatus]XP_023229728.1 uncharacterized protein LOC111629983 [Centruroides sculpturatus]
MAETMDFSECLINEVRTYPWLYDIRRADYKDNIKKNNSWREISKKLNVEESLVKKRWQNIRDQYRRKNKEENLPSGSGGRKRQQWAYFNMLSFLRPGIEQINTISNFVEEKESSPNHINLGEANTGNNSEDSNKEFENVQSKTFEMSCPDTILTTENNDIDDCLKACTSSSSGSSGCNKKKRKNNWEKKFLCVLKTTNTPIVETKHDSDYYYFMSLSERFREIKCKKKRNNLRKKIEEAFAEAEESE